MNDVITKILGIEDKSIIVTAVKTYGKFKDVFIERKLEEVYCPKCGFRMHSKGCTHRTVNHPVIQDGFALRLRIKQRRYICTNPDCKFSMQEPFSFVEKNRRNTNTADMLIVEAFRDYNTSVKSIANRYNVSDTYAYYTFLRYVDLPRRTLPEALCVDEVFLGISKYKKYALVLQDFKTGEPVDLVISRRENYTFPYFAKIPVNERKHVKYLITDMYAPYEHYIEKYFYSAKHVVDSFHVVALINRHFNNYIIQVQRRILERDKRLYEERKVKFGINYEFHPSKEYYLLKTKRWVLLKSPSNMRAYGWHYDSKFKCEMSSHDYELALYDIDPSFKELQTLKNKYIELNDKFAGNPTKARSALKTLIQEYSESKYKMFRDIAATLSVHIEAIICSFTLVERYMKSGEMKLSRLSNGPIEALNRIPKDMKRNARGFKNFSYVRNRFLFSQRKNAAILGCPKTMDEVRLHAGPKRGPYVKRRIVKKVNR